MVLVGCMNGAGGLYEQDDLGTTPLMQLIHLLNNPFTWEGQDAAREEEEEEERDLVAIAMEDQDDNDGPQPQNNEQIVNFDMDEVTLANTNVAITSKPKAK